ncbi:hypothetical protein CXP39_02175 [Mesoplasma syrphidae]|uniref:Uncharacterized protein n=1 Tax=Mesoplasma syrphidae TaxID=225999 RepID=A0A2K9BZ03_9MOLU|nr:hypothetical protein [Mesoplasma syrphidae]AUF83598.1 hypothetical protein CXP39_02175 [Mesoplasma syrphidae]
MEFGLYLYLVLSFSAALELTLIPYLVTSLSWRFKTKFVILWFGKEIDTKSFPLLLKSDKLKLLCWYYITAILNTTLYIVFCFLIPIGYQEFWIYILLITIIYLLSVLSIVYLQCKFKNKIKHKTFFSKKEAVKYYVMMLNDYENINFYDNFVLYENKKVSVHNGPIQFNQKRFQKKLQKNVNNKNALDKEFKIFLNYLRIYGAIINRIDYYQNLDILHNNKKDSIEVLPSILINNFVYMRKIFYNDNKLI